MDKNSTFKSALDSLQKRIGEKHASILQDFLYHYKIALGDEFENHTPEALLFLNLVEKHLKDPPSFSHYHKKIRTPIDYYTFSLDFLRPLIDQKKSKVTGLENLEKLLPKLEQKENIILFANHQTESDPQAISLLLESTHPKIGESIIYVAGERVLIDPLAIPFSLGCDLLCVYSKRYMDNLPHLKSQKQLHNKRTMETMCDLMREGGKIIYVAPSGGRDRKSTQNIIEVAPFDPASIEMFDLMARKSGVKAHVLPLALATYELLPPPAMIQKEIGEIRIAKKTPIFLAFGPQFSMDAVYAQDKKINREKRAHALWEIVSTLHSELRKI